MYTRQKNVTIFRQTWREAAPVVSRLFLEKRRVDHSDGGTNWYGPTYERRLTVLINIVARIGIDEYRNLVDPIAAHIFEEPLDDGGDINELVGLIISLDNKDMNEFSALDQPLRERVFEMVKQGCRSDELREAIRILDDPPSEDDLNKLRAGYAVYLEHYFSNERSECYSDDDFDGLIADLMLFKETLGVQTDALVSEVDEARQDFLESEEQYTYAQEDEYKVRWRAERYENESIADMFASLKSDRDG